MEPYKIYDFEDEKAWLKGRLNGIGGSDASAVVGKNRKCCMECERHEECNILCDDLDQYEYMEECPDYVKENKNEERITDS